MAGNNKTIPPLPDQIEVSIFGPGFGECIVVHLGQSEWMIVDSCVHAESGVPVALNYFDDLGVSARDVVKLVVSTHWHDDHIKGLGRLFAECESARFACSMALRTDEWITLLESYNGYVHSAGSGVDEMREVMKELARRTNIKEPPAPKFAIANRPLFERKGPLSAFVIALSPSDSAITCFQAQMQQKLLPKPGCRRSRVPTLRENDSSVVLSVRVGNASFLLGADLEERGRPGLGWQVILDTLDPGHEGFEGFKIPHHGSETGYHTEQWSRLMNTDAWAAMTPYNRGNKLPNLQDCKRILRHTQKAYITAPPGLGKFRHDNATVQKTMSEATISIGQELSKQGHIRFRLSTAANDANWNVELFEDAQPLLNLLSLL